MKHAVHVGSIFMVYIPSFIMFDSGILKLVRVGAGVTDTETTWRPHKPTLFFSK
jgi:hypothetical protein